MSETPNPYTEGLRDEVERYPFAYGALDAAVDGFLKGLNTAGHLANTRQQLRDGLAVVKAEARDSAVTS